MSGLPLRCVVDTNVPMTANRANPGASPNCVTNCAKALQAVMSGGHVFVDDGGRIVAEYRSNLSARGQPGPGDAFFKWLLTHEWGGQKVTRVRITSTTVEDEFAELPDCARYDRSDRKFLAVSAAHTERPQILQSLDSKWWGWRETLVKVGIVIHFLCEDEISAKYAQKMRRE